MSDSEDERDRGCGQAQVAQDGEEGWHGHGCLLGGVALIPTLNERVERIHVYDDLAGAVVA